jgi:hypothetical protein
MERVGVGFDEPKEFFDDCAKEDSLCGEQGEDVVAKRETELGRSKDGESSSSSSIGPGFTVGEDVTDKVEVLIFFVLGEAAFFGR